MGSPANRRPPSDLVVITRAKDLCAYVMQVTRSSPKVFRFTFVSRMQNLALDVVEKLFRANETFVAEGDTAAADRCLELQHEASVSLKMLLYVAEMAAGQGCLTMKQYEVISDKGFDVGNMKGGWIKSDKERFRSA